MPAIYDLRAVGAKYGNNVERAGHLAFMGKTVVQSSGFATVHVSALDNARKNIVTIGIVDIFGKIAVRCGPTAAHHSWQVVTALDGQLKIAN